jgi:hypothetical protein
VTKFYLNDRTIDLGDAHLSVNLHASTKEEAAECVRRMLEFAGEQWDPRYNASGSTVWMNQTVNIGTEEEPVKFNLTLFFPYRMFVPPEPAPDTASLAAAWVKEELADA